MEYLIEQSNTPEAIKKDLTNIAAKYTDAQPEIIKVSIADNKVFEARGPGGVIFSFKLTEFPGCCGIMTSFNVSVNPLYRNKGLGTELHNYRKVLSKVNGYTTMICAYADHNEAQYRILKNNNWENVYTFTNNRTSNRIIVSCCDLYNDNKVKDTDNHLQAPAKQKTITQKIAAVLWKIITFKKFWINYEDSEYTLKINTNSMTDEVLKYCKANKIRTYGYSITSVNDDGNPLAEWIKSTYGYEFKSDKELFIVVGPK